MINLLAQFKHVIEGFEFFASMQHNAPLPIWKEMAFALLKHLGNVEDLQKAQAEEKLKAEAEAKAVEGVPAVEEVQVEQPLQSE